MARETRFVERRTRFGIHEKETPLRLPVEDTPSSLYDPTTTGLIINLFTELFRLSTYLIGLLEEHHRLKIYRTNRDVDQYIHR